MTPPVTLLVNSSDGFEDCWRPFFRLLEVHWPDLELPILLNTETKTCDTIGRGIKSSRVASGEDRRLSWSECLIRAIDQIETPLLLYMQEDYFLSRPVRVDVLDRIVRMMIEHPQIAHVGLTKHGSRGPFLPHPLPGLSEIRRNARYRISTQAGLWRPKALRSYLDPTENGWMFEIFGTRRAAKRDDLFLTVDLETTEPVFDYTHTGIIKGKWHKAIPGLFMQHGIEMDFSRRGFYNPPPAAIRKWAVLRKLAENPVRALRYLLG